MSEEFSLGESDNYTLGDTDTFTLDNSFEVDTSELQDKDSDKIDIEDFYKNFVGAFVNSKYKENEYEDFILQGKIKAKLIYDFFKIKPFQKPSEAEKEKITELCNKLISEAEIFTRTDVEKRNILVNCIGTLKSIFTTGKSSIISERLKELTWNSLDITIDEKCEDGIVSMSEIVNLLKAGIKLGLVYDFESKKSFFNELKNKIDERNARIESFEVVFKEWFEEYASKNPEAYSTTLKNQLIIARKYKELELLAGNNIKTSDKEYVINFEKNLEKLGIKLGERKEKKQTAKETKDFDKDSYKEIDEIVLPETGIETIKENQNINLTPDMIFVEGGTFNMGCNNQERNERPVHQVSIKDFYISNHLVSQQEYMSLMNNNPSYFEDNNNPVESISWYNAIEYCNRKSVLDNLTPCYTLNGVDDVSRWDTKLEKWDNIFCNISVNGYRLPTEEEWEYAARGGKKLSANNYLYSGSNDINSVAFYYVNSNDSTHNIMQLQPNELGIYDMSGNVSEWCWDWFYKYTEPNQINPTRKLTNFFRIIRGGGWNDIAFSCRVSFRNYAAPNMKNNKIGFRVVRSHLP